jgi:hypothetical protein
MSGYAPEETATMQGATEELAVLNKPWNTAELIRRVRELLDGVPTTS